MGILLSFTSHPWTSLTFLFLLYSYLYLPLIHHIAYYWLMYRFSLTYNFLPDLVMNTNVFLQHGRVDQSYNA